MAAGMLYLNGLDCETVGFSLMEAPVIGGVNRTFHAVTIPRRAGQVVTQVDPDIAPRTLTIKGRIGSAASTYATLDASIDAIRAAIGAGLVEIKHVYNTAKAWYGYLASDAAIQQEVLTLLDGYALLTVTFVCFDPYAYAVTPSIVGFNATATAIPLGTQPISPKTIISNVTGGTLTNFTLTQRNAAGTTVQSLVLTGSLLTMERLEIDHLLCQINKYDASNVKTSARSWRTSGDYFVLHAGDTLDVDKGTGQALYWKAY